MDWMEQQRILLQKYTAYLERLATYGPEGTVYTVTEVYGLRGTFWPLMDRMDK